MAGRLFSLFKLNGNVSSNQWYYFKMIFNQILIETRGWCFVEKFLSCFKQL